MSKRAGKAARFALAQVAMLIQMRLATKELTAHSGRVIGARRGASLACLTDSAAGVSTVCAHGTNRAAVLGSVALRAPAGAVLERTVVLPPEWHATRSPTSCRHNSHPAHASARQLAFVHHGSHDCLCTCPLQRPQPPQALARQSLSFVHHGMHRSAHVTPFAFATV